MVKTDFDFTERELIMLKTPPSHGSLTFFHPCYGPKRYNTIEEATRSVGGLRIATMTELVSILSFYSDLRREDYREIKDLMKSRYLWTSTGILPSTRGEGVYVQDRVESKVKGGGEGLAHMDESELVKRLEANDPNVRFASNSYKAGTMTPSELSKNELFIALTNEASAKAMAKIASRIKKDVYFDEPRKNNNDGLVYTITLSSRNSFCIDTCTGNLFGYAFLVADPSYSKEGEDLESKPKQLQEYISREKAKRDIEWKKLMENKEFRNSWDSLFKR